MSTVKAFGFESPSISLTKVSGDKRPAPGRAQLPGEPWAGRWCLHSSPGPAGHHGRPWESPLFSQGLISSSVSVQV